MSGSESQLDERQVIELKARFRDNPELIADVTAHIVDGFMAELLREEEPWFKNEADLQLFVDGNRRVWARALNEVIEIPGADWPGGLTPPSTFAEALEAVQADAAS